MERNNTRLGALLVYAWQRWGAAERALTRLGVDHGPRFRAAEARSEFWRRAHNAVEAALEARCRAIRRDHAAAARNDCAPSFNRPIDTPLAENMRPY